MLTATRAVMMAHPGTAFTAACPVLTGRVRIARKRPAVQLRAGQNVMPVGSVPPTVDHLALFVKLRAYSGPNRPLIPIESGHLFRGKPAGVSGAK